MAHNALNGRLPWPTVGGWDDDALNSLSPKWLFKFLASLCTGSGHTTHIFKQEHKVSYRCSLPPPLQKRSKDYKILHGTSASFLWLWKEVSQKSEKLLDFSPRKFRSSKLSYPPNPWISSAMVMAMSIYRTLCVLVSTCLCAAATCASWTQKGSSWTFCHTYMWQSPLCCS